MKDNDFRQLADHEFAQLNWTDRQRMDTLRKMQKEERPVIKRKLSVMLAITLLLLTITGTALAATYRGVSWFLTEQNCEPTTLDPELLMIPLEQNHTSKHLNVSVEDAYWDGNTLSIAIHVTASDPSMIVSIPCDTVTHEHYRPIDGADVLLEMPEFINITAGNEIFRPLGSSANWLYEEDGTLTIMHSFVVNDMSKPIGISIPINTTIVSSGTKESAMLHCNLPALADPITAHEHDWAPATCVSPEICTICGRSQGGLGKHNFQPEVCEGTRTCTVCTLTIEAHHEADPDNPGACIRCGEIK